MRNAGFVIRSVCGLVLAGALLVAGSGAAQGQVRVVVCDVHAPGMDANQAAAPSISIVGARGGSFCGKVVIVSGQPVAGLRATVGDLTQAGATIPTPAATARCAVAWDTSGNIWPQGPDILLDTPPAEAPSGTPVWVTVKVPRDAKPGLYTGQLTIQAQSLPPTAMPVRLDVRDWTLPESQDYRTWVELMEQPDTLAVEYDVPLWSPKHWDLVAQGLRLLADSGSRVIYVPLIARTNYGNAESMVRWVRKGPNQYDHDFSPVEKYLDLVEKNLGKPKITMVYAWETYLRRPKETPATVEVKGAEGSYEWREAMALKSAIENRNRGPAVTVLEAATGKTDTLYLPRYEDPAAQALWRPVWEGLRKRLAQRGWDKSMMVASFSDYYPAKEEAAVLNELSGGLPWAGCAHHVNTIVENKTLGKVGPADIGYAAVALDQYYAFDPAKGGHLYGWKQSTLHAQYHRFQAFNGTLLYVRTEVERLITGNKRGVAHIGGDYWPCLKNRAGKRTGIVTDRYPESYWHSLNVQGWMLAPGPAGPVATARYEMFREGIQECEARIAIETALSDESRKARLGADLARRAQDCLDERLTDLWKGIGVPDADIEKTPLITAYRDWYFGVAKRADPKAGLRWYVASGWQGRQARLFDLAGEVQKKLGAR